MILIDLPLLIAEMNVKVGGGACGGHVYSGDTVA